MIPDVARAKIVKLHVPSSFANLAEPHQININHTLLTTNQDRSTAPSPHPSAFPQCLLHPSHSAAMPATTAETLSLVTRNVSVAPLVLLSAADHYGRQAKGTRKRVVGVLLGQNDGKNVRVSNSFAGASRFLTCTSHSST